MNDRQRNPRLDRLIDAAPRDGARIALVSTWDVENNAVRILAATLRAQGHHTVEIYFKDWISNHLDPASAEELDALTRVLRREQVNLVTISIRASAYAEQARVITEHVQRELDLPVLWGGMHPTLRGDDCIDYADMTLAGEGELALADLANRLVQKDDEVFGTQNVWFRMERDLERGSSSRGPSPVPHATHVRRNSLRPHGHQPR